MRLRFTLLSLLAFAPLTFAQRLPANVTPSHYSLHFAPDLKNATFTGSETIDVQLQSASPEIRLNALDLKIGSLSAIVAGHSQAGTVRYDPAQEQATLTFPAALPAHVPVQLKMEFTGVLNDQLRGFYLSKTSKRSYAVTQFESTDARRAFPSFDEPAFKATFDISLTVDAGDTVISNGVQVSDVPAGAGKHTLTFSTTPRMSTYLVAFQVGDFQCVRGNADGVAVGVCAPPDKLPLTSAALKDAEHFLHYYDDYFGIKYPLPKLDMVAIPDFEAGAMENFGCITYRETDLLLDDAHASLEQRKQVAAVVAHEMAHQWFGDLVTMQWWNNLWLNEGFATWMEAKALEAWHPEWGVAEDTARSLEFIKDLDAAPTTRSVQSPADTPAQINEQFDGLSYGKAGGVLGMVENFVGAETFRAGVQKYLRAHLYSNATAEDFWNAQTETSRKPVDRIMRSFVTEPGIPLLTFGAPENGTASVTEARFFLQSKPTEQSWAVPVCPGGQCQVVEGPRSTIRQSGITWVNAGQHGYYRSAYDPSTLKAIASTAETKLTAPERIGLYGDQWAQVQAGVASIADMLTLAEQLRTDSNSAVLDTIRLSLMTTRDDIATDAERPKFLAWVRSTFRPMYDALPPQGHDEPGAAKERRAKLFQLLANAQDPAVWKQAEHTTDQFLAGEPVSDPDQETSALAATASHGDAALFARVQQFYVSANDPQKRSNALLMLETFSDPVLIKRALDFATSGKVSKQDSASLMAGLLSRRASRDQAWAYIQGNWPAVSQQFTTFSGAYVINAAGTFCSTEARSQVAGFFASHPVPATDRALKGSLENIAGCARMREEQQPAFSQWLKAR